ncbi:MAG: hypothetical protein HY686_02380, partial [Chloroflexi bacterium]|nr:hypothetical protein [Chloroflexota bacterium]
QADEEDPLITNLKVNLNSQCGWQKKFAREIASLSIRIGKALRLSPRSIAYIQLAAMSHDVGNLGASYRLAFAPTERTKDSLAISRDHIAQCTEMMRSTGVMDEIVQVMEQHHEYLNGTGCRGLRGGQIRVEAQALGVADMYVTLTWDWLRAPGLPPLEAVERMRARGVEAFGLELVKALEAALVERVKSLST